MADRGDVERRERVHVTRGEPAQPAIAEAGFFLVIDECLERRADPVRGLARFGLEPERHEIRAELRPDQILGREVDHRALPIREDRSRRIDPAMQQAIANRIGECQILIV